MGVVIWVILGIPVLQLTEIFLRDPVFGLWTLDFDHCGDLVDFPGARVHVRTVEHERAHQPVTAMDKLRYLSRHFDHGPLWQLYDDPGGDAWYGFDTVRPLVGLDDDILLVALPGHSVGHVGVAVRGETGWILHAGDAYYQRKHLFDPPTLANRMIRRQIDEDAQIAGDTQKRLAKVIDSMAEQTIEVIAPANGAVFESVLMRYLGQEGDSRRPSPTSNRTPERRDYPQKRPEN